MGLDTQLVFGVDVEGLGPGEAAIIDADVLGYPLRSITEIPPGEYWVQGVLHRYETFHRADGHTVKLPINRGEGVKWNKAPGNFYSTPRKLRIDPTESQRIDISLDQEIPPIPEPGGPQRVIRAFHHSQRRPRPVPKLGPLEIADKSAA